MREVAKFVFVLPRDSGERDTLAAVSRQNKEGFAEVAR